VSQLFDERRYLTNFDSRRTGHILTDVLVIGSGVAGTRAAIEAADHVDDVLLICKSGLSDSVTRHAQGGIAGVRAATDSIELHVEDTMRVGCGLSNREVVELVVRQARERLDELIEWGVVFDRDGDEIALTREGGHSVSRILHCAGDRTGRELSRVLCDRVRHTKNVRVFEQCFLIDLITQEGRCVGAVAWHETFGHQLIWARRTILASGGAGRLYRETSNPEVATGDGLAAAYRAGATLADLEMVQFHPTTLYVAGAARALISEAVRGEGGRLVDRAGERFMDAFHTDAELAPRDVVSRAIHSHMRATRTNCVFLDVRHIGREKFAARFPGISRLCEDFQIDVGSDLIPVRPAAHYFVGGVWTGIDASTSIDGLLCCGEVACTGLHGANRLASNSLLEGLVFGKVAGETAGTQAASASGAMHHHPIRNDIAQSQRTELDLDDVRNSCRSVMWRNVGIERHGDRLAETRDIIEFWGDYVLDKTFDDRLGWETQNMLSLSRLVAMSALSRPESIGVHYRVDDVVESKSDDASCYHTQVRRTGDGPNLSRE
jgi:L-aspartate oxidase